MTDYRDTIRSRNRQQTGIGFGDIADAAGDVADAGSDAVSSGVDSATDTVDNVTSTVDDTVSDATDSVEDTASDVQDSGGFLGIGGSALEDAGEQASDSAESAFGSLTGGAGEVADLFAGEGAADSVSDTADSLFGGAQDAAESAADGAFSALGGGAEEAQDTAESLFSDASSVAGDAASSIGSLPGGAVDAVENAGGAIGDVAGGVDDFVDDSIDSASGIGDAIIEDTQDNLGAVGDVAEEGFDAYTDVQGEVLDFYGDVGEGAVDAAGSAGNIAGDIIGGGIDVGSTVAGGAANWVGGLAGGAANVAGNIGGSIGQAVGGVVSGGKGNSASGEWAEPSQHEEYGQGVILSQTHPNNPTRYFAVTRDQSNNVVALRSGGQGVQLQSVQRMGELPNYQQASGARSAIDAAGVGPNSSESDNGNSSPSAQWGPLSEVGTTGSCVVMVQESNEGDQRYFTLTEGDDGSVVAVNSNGEGVVVESVESTGELPHYPTRAQAEQACPSEPGQPSNGGEGGSSDDSSRPIEDSGSWGQLTEASQVGSCVVMSQTHTDGTERFFTFTENGDGQTVAVYSDSSTVPVDSVGEMAELPNYPTLEDAEAACPSEEGQPSQGGQGGGQDVTRTSDSGSSSQPAQGGSSSGPLGVGGSLLEGEIAGVPRIAVLGGAGVVGLAAMLSGGDGGQRFRTLARQRGTSPSSNRQSGARGGN